MAELHLHAHQALQSPAVRAKIENTIAKLIDLLDRTDGDPDTEAVGDELEDSEALQLGIDELGRWASAEIMLAPWDCDDDEAEPETLLVT